MKNCEFNDLSKDFYQQDVPKIQQDQNNRSQSFSVGCKTYRESQEQEDSKRE
jgi:hypothetical protein